MKCPKCHYLGFETGDRCKNCGYDFSLLALADETPHPDLPLRPQDDAAAEGQRLGRGAGAEESLELLVGLWVENDTRAERTWHEQPPCTQGNRDRVEG